MALEELNRKNQEGCRVFALHEPAATASGGTTRTLSAGDSGAVHLLDSAGGVAYTLPVPVAGMQFAFYASVAVTASDVYSITTDAATTFIGGTVLMGIAATDTNESQVGDETSDVTITMNGGTTGGLEGTYIELYALSTTVWLARRSHIIGSGSLATPFA
ncbi:MAG: hypothetical protein V3R25_09175 [Nitrosomonadaceae bacterium]